MEDNAFFVTVSVDFAMPCNFLLVPITTLYMACNCFSFLGAVLLFTLVVGPRALSAALLTTERFFSFLLALQHPSVASQRDTGILRNSVSMFNRLNTAQLFFPMKSLSDLL